MGKKKSSDSCLGVMLKMTILLVILAAILVGGGIFAYQKLNEFFNRSGGNVLVPDFRGRHTTEVMKIKPPNIEVVTRDQKYDDRQPKGYVIAQYPDPGTLVKPGKQVLITVSLGLQKVNVPNLIGKSMREVDVALMNSQLILGNSAYVFSDKISPDRIVGQSPMSSEEYGVNKNVDLLISLGKKPETLPLPNLTGINLDTAKERIKSWGFNIGRTYSKPDSNRAKYQVISTSPSPYSHLRKGEVVNILVSSGSDSGTATAEDIKKFEFNIVSTPRVVETTKPANITSPTPASSDSNKKEQEKPGVVVESKPKENVEIVAKPVVTPASTSAVSQPQSTKPTKDVIYVMPDGFMPKEVKFIHIKPDGREQIYSGTHKPLDSIKVKVPIVPNSKIQIYINDVPVEERKID
ncbi:MAG: PASTA domain-containing protein [Candidatus Riflebacteria bacterium]|nr:PASTA domain-containing protein [Candidatus Riflebacteria bacterium]